MSEPQHPSPTPSGRSHRHRIAAAFESEADADAALAALAPLVHEVQVDVHLPGCHDIDEAERGVGQTMLLAILVATPLTILVVLGLGALFRDPLGDLALTDVLAIAIGAGGILGILLGGIAGLALSQRRFEEARASSGDHLAEEVLVAHVERGALHNPNWWRAEYQGKRTRVIVDDLETQVRRVFEEHHGHLLDA